MLSRALLNQIVSSESLVRGLADPEARVLVEWLVDRAEECASREPEPGPAVARLCLRGRAIGRFVVLWCHQDARAAASQLAATERFNWPLPNSRVDPYRLMQAILHWEENEQKRPPRLPP